MNIRAMMRPKIPTGRFIKNTALQPKLSIKGPPIRGPNTAAAANDEDHMPSAMARSRPFLNVTATIAIAVG